MAHLSRPLTILLMLHCSVARGQDRHETVPQPPVASTSPAPTDPFCFNGECAMAPDLATSVAGRDWWMRTATFDPWLTAPLSSVSGTCSAPTPCTTADGVAECMSRAQTARLLASGCLSARIAAGLSYEVACGLGNEVACRETLPYLELVGTCGLLPDSGVPARVPQYVTVAGMADVATARDNATASQVFWVERAGMAATRLTAGGSYSVPADTARDFVYGSSESGRLSFSALPLGVVEEGVGRRDVLPDTPAATTADPGPAIDSTQSGNITRGAAFTFNYTPTSGATRVVFDTCGSGFDTLLAIPSRGLQDDDGAGCGGSSSSLSIDRPAPLEVRVTGYSGASGRVQLRIHEYGVQAATTTGATRAAGSLRYGVPASTGAADAIESTLSGNVTRGAPYTFSYTPTPGVTRVVFDTCGSGFDTLLAIPSRGLQDDDGAGCGGSASSLSIDRPAPLEVRVAGYSGASGRVQLRIHEYGVQAATAVGASASRGIRVWGPAAFSVVGERTCPLVVAGVFGQESAGDDLRHRFTGGSSVPIRERAGNAWTNYVRARQIVALREAVELPAGTDWTPVERLQEEFGCRLGVEEWVARRVALSRGQMERMRYVAEFVPSDVARPIVGIPTGGTAVIVSGITQHLLLLNPTARLLQTRVEACGNGQRLRIAVQGVPLDQMTCRLDVPVPANGSVLADVHAPVGDSPMTTYTVSASANGVVAPRCWGSAAQSITQGGEMVGREVVLHRHAVVSGADNWTAAMDAFVGQTTVITRLQGTDAQGEAIARVAADTGRFAWRLSSMTLPGRAAPEVASTPPLHLAEVWSTMDEHSAYIERAVSDMLPVACRGDATGMLGYVQSVGGLATSAEDRAALFGAVAGCIRQRPEILALLRRVHPPRGSA